MKIQIVINIRGAVIALGRWFVSFIAVPYESKSFASHAKCFKLGKSIVSQELWQSKERKVVRVCITNIYVTAVCESSCNDRGDNSFLTLRVLWLTDEYLLTWTPICRCGALLSLFKSSFYKCKGKYVFGRCKTEVIYFRLKSEGISWVIIIDSSFFLEYLHSCYSVYEINIRCVW